MSEPSSLPIYKEAYLLSREVFKIKMGLAKDLKHTLGEKMFNTSLQCIEHIILSSDETDKAHHLNRLSIETELMWTWLRLLYDMRGISQGQFKLISERVHELNTQAINWKRWYKSQKARVSEV